MQTLLNFTQVESSCGPLFRAHLNGCTLELSLDKKILQVIASDSRADTYEIIGGECNFVSSTEDETVCENWTADDWYAVENAIREA